MDEHEGIFKHECITDGCDRIVEFDDEPWCFTHSPDEGSSVPGYSAREHHQAYMQMQREHVKKQLLQLRRDRVG